MLIGIDRFGRRRETNQTGGEMRSAAAILPEISFDSRFSSARKRTVGDIFGLRILGLSEKISKLEEYVRRLRDEMEKIGGLKRELPLCMILLTDAIVAMEDELGQCRKSNPVPVLEEFLPLKRGCKDEKADILEKDVISSREKRSWMSSVQLWNSNTDSNKNKRVDEMIVPATMFPVIGKEKRDIGLPVPSLSLCTPEVRKFEEGIINPINPMIGFTSKSCSSSRSVGSSSRTINNVQLNARKQRRCWSPELHRRFTSALQQLGGAQVATPKQIRELMKIDGLTNDEVKSHLQKYRLHKQRLSANPSSQSVGLWLSEEQQCNESLLKQRDCSPNGPLHLEGSPEGNYGSNEDEDEDE